MGEGQRDFHLWPVTWKKKKNLTYSSLRPVIFIIWDHRQRLHCVPSLTPALEWGFGFRPRRDSVCKLIRDKTEFYMEPLEEQGVEAEPGARWVIVGIWAFY